MDFNKIGLQKLDKAYDSFWSISSMPDATNVE